MAGVIVNDFHKCKDLTPDISAVYMEEVVRIQEFARALLFVICYDAK